jgi:spore coat protein H
MSFNRRRPLGLLIALIVVASVSPTAAQEEEEEEEREEVVLPSDVLFNPEVVQRLDLRVHSADWERLQQQFGHDTYYPADLVFNGQTVRNTGIRSRGGGSRSRDKPGLRVDFDRYASDQTFLGLKSIVLDNLTQDSSGVRETVAMRFFARIGIPSPREAHIRLYVNGAYLGVYAVIESIDKSFLARAFGSIDDNVQNDGFLFDFEWIDTWTFTYLGRDLEPYQQRFIPQTHKTKSDQELFGPIETLVRLANELYPERYLPVLSEYLDLHAFVRFVAGQNFVAENDGFLGYDGVNNFYLYRLEDSLQHVLIPWDDDNAFRGAEYPIFYRHDDNVLTGNAMAVPELKDLYVQVLRESIRVAEEPTGEDGVPWLEHETRRQLDLIWDAMAEDPVRPYAFGEHERAREEMIVFARERAQSVREQLYRHGFGETPGPAATPTRIRKSPSVLDPR